MAIRAAINGFARIRCGVLRALHASNRDNRIHIVSINNALNPIKTRSPASIGLVLPNLEGKLDDVSVRIPTLNVTLLDLTISTKKTQR